MQRPPEQPVQAKLEGKEVQPLPLEQSMQAASETKQPNLEQTQKLPAQQSEQGKSKGKQPMRKPVYGNPRFWIARIPVKRKARLQRVVISIAPDTVSHHPQTFFFKNLPAVDPYWGYTNDSAWTARRVVRLETEGKPTPYFLMVCRGEHPKIKSPRNDNVIFADMHEPIFNDAFVFKLADPEIDEDGWANYIHIEEDIDGIDWLPEAIRDAAQKVHNAMARDANPGFPDIENYADPKTMKKDEKTMLSWKRQIKKALLDDATWALPDHETVACLVERMTILVVGRRMDGVSSMDGGPESPDLKTPEYWRKRALTALETLHGIVDNVNASQSMDGVLSASIGSPDAKTTDTVGWDDSFQEMMDAFYSFIANLANAKREAEGGGNTLKIDRAIEEAQNAFLAMKAEVDKQ